MAEPEIQYRPMPPRDDEPTTVRIPRPSAHAGEEPAPGEPHKDIAVPPQAEYVTAQTTPPAIEAWKRVGIASLIALAFAIDHVLEARQLNFTWEQSITGGLRNWFDQMRPTLITFGGIYAVLDQFARAKRVEATSTTERV